MRSKSTIFLLVVVLMVAAFAAPAPSPAQAQDQICTTSNTITVPGTSSGTISNTIYVVPFCFNGTSGQTVTISANATSGDLDTYIALFDPTLEEVYGENDDIESGNTDSELTVTLPVTQQYVILVSRFGVDEGTSTGNFTVNITTSGGSTTPGLDSVNFDFPAVGDGTSSGNFNNDGSIFITCDTGEEVRGGVQFSFIAVNPGFSYTATAIGLDGFDPVVTVETRPGIGTCNDDNSGVLGSRVDVPGFGNVFADNTSAQVRFTSPSSGNPINISVGSFNDEPGRFVLIIEGLAISPFTELDGFAVRVPEAAQEEPLGVYMVARYVDLDPYLALYAGDGLTNAYSADGTLFPDSIDYDQVFGPLFECDDAGVGDCDYSPNFENGNILISNGSSYNPGSVDAGLMLVPNTTDPLLYTFGSRNGASGGTYAILVTGFVPGP